MTALARHYVAQTFELRSDQRDALSKPVQVEGASTIKKLSWAWDHKGIVSFAWAGSISTGSASGRS